MHENCRCKLAAHSLRLAQLSQHQLTSRKVPWAPTMSPWSGATGSKAISYRTEATGSLICSQARTCAATAGLAEPAAVAKASAPDTVTVVAELCKNPARESGRSTADILTHTGRLEIYDCTFRTDVRAVCEEDTARRGSVTGTNALTPSRAKSIHADARAAAAIVSSVGDIHCTVVQTAVPFGLVGEGSLLTRCWKASCHKSSIMSHDMRYYVMIHRGYQFWLLLRSKGYDIYVREYTYNLCCELDFWSFQVDIWNLDVICCNKVLADILRSTPLLLLFLRNRQKIK